MLRASSLSLLLALAPLVVSACKRDGESAATPTATVSPSATGPDPGAHGPPVVMHLEATPATDGSGDADLTIEIDVRAPIAVPATMRITVPAGATLTAGAQTDTVDVSHPGLSRRQIHIKAPAPLTEATPLFVSLEARDLDAGVGFRAERQWPPRAEAVPPTRGAGPHPPGGRPSPMPSST